MKNIYKYGYTFLLTTAMTLASQAVPKDFDSITNEEISKLSVSNIYPIQITNNSAKISWNVSEYSTGQVEYGETTAYGSFNKKEKSFNYKHHEQSLSNLEKCTTYHYRVISENKNQERIKSYDYSFQTQCTLSQKNIHPMNITNNRATISWDASQYSTGQVEYGETTAYGSFNKKEKSFKYKHHEQSLRNLKPGTRYYYRVISEDSKRNNTVSVGYTFTTLGTKGELPARAIDNNLPNLIQDTNPNFNTLDTYKNTDKHRYIASDSHTNDGSGSAELLAHHWKKALSSKKFPVKKGKKYLLSGYVKMTNVPHGQNVTIALLYPWVAGWSEVAWNVSKANEWQEILMPFIPVVDGNVQWGAFTTNRAFSTDRRVYEHKITHIDIYEPKEVKKDGSNLDRTSHVFFDDFKVVEMKEEITPREPVNTNKKTFSSEYIRVDKLGNMSVKKEGKWTDIIPKLIYRGVLKNEDKFPIRLKAYATHGFNGVIGIYNVEQAKKVFDAGLEYFVGMGAMSNTQPDGTEGEYSSIVTGAAKRFKEKIAYIKTLGKPYAQLYHLLDNENEKVQEYTFKEKWAAFIDANDKDTNGHRARPIFYLNGTFGISRLYSKKLMDMTGSYVGLGGTGNPQPGAPKPTIGVMDVTQGHDIPSNVIQLQVYLDDKFIPSLWFGIIQGGKVISVWSDGEGKGSDLNRPKPFQKYAWAKDIKKVFDQVDSMAAIIREPHWTTWKVHFSGSEYVNLGTREHQGKRYVILSNHSDKDETITLSFEGISPTLVKDLFGKGGSIDVENGKATVTLGHGNNGYMVLELVK